MKVLKERRNNEDVEVDLRGMGNDPVINDIHPEPILSLWSNIDHKALQDAITQLPIASDVRTTSEGNLHHIFFTKPSRDQYKHKTIDLFVSMIVLTKLNKSIDHISIWTADKFGVQMHERHKQKISSQRIEDYLSHATHQKKGFLELSPMVSTILHQAELISASDIKNGIHLSHEELNESIKKLGMKHQKTQLRRVGT